MSRLSCTNTIACFIGDVHDNPLDLKLVGEETLPGVLQKRQRRRIADREHLTAASAKQLFDKQQFAEITHHLLLLAILCWSLMGPDFHAEWLNAIDESVEVHATANLWASIETYTQVLLKRGEDLGFG